MALPMEKLSVLKGKELREELERLRGAQSFTTHRGKVPQRIKEGASEDDGKNKMKLIIIAAAAAAFAYMMM